MAKETAGREADREVDFIPFTPVAPYAARFPVLPPPLAMVSWWDRAVVPSREWYSFLGL